MFWCSGVTLATSCLASTLENGWMRRDNYMIQLVSYWAWLGPGPFYRLSTQMTSHISSNRTPQLALRNVWSLFGTTFALCLMDPNGFKKKMLVMGQCHWHPPDIPSASSNCCPNASRNWLSDIFGILEEDNFGPKKSQRYSNMSFDWDIRATQLVSRWPKRFKFSYFCVKPSNEPRKSAWCWPKMTKRKGMIGAMISLIQLAMPAMPSRSLQGRHSSCKNASLSDGLGGMDVSNNQQLFPVFLVKRVT